MFFTKFNTRTSQQVLTSSSMLNPIQFNIYKDDVFLSLGNVVFTKLRNDLPLSKQFSNLFYSSNNGLNFIETELFKSGTHLNTGKIFSERTKKVICPLFLKQGKFPDYHITFRGKKCVQFFDFSEHYLKDLIIQYLSLFEYNESWKLVEKTDVRNIYTVKTFNWKLCKPVKVHFDNQNNNFDRVSQEHLDIVDIFKNNDSILPNMFNFVFYFDDDGELDEYSNNLFLKTDFQDLDLDFIDLNERFDLNLENTYNNIPSFRIETDGEFNLRTKNILLGEIENRFYFLNDKNNNMYMTKSNSERDLCLLDTYKVNIKDFMGATNKTSSINVANSIFSGPSFQNIKLEIFNQSTPIFRTGDYIAIKDLDENVEYRFIANEDETCNCEKELNKVCKIEGKTSIFKPFDVFWYSNNSDDLKNVRFRIKGIWNLYENDDIEVSFKSGLDNKTTLISKIFKLKHIKIDETDFTEFYLYERSFDSETLTNIKEWVFFYKQPDIYYNFFNRFLNISNLIERIKEITNENWKDVINLKVQRNTKKDNEFIFVSKTTKTRNLKLIINLSKLSSYKSIYVNDIQFDPVRFNNYYDRDFMSYNETQFLKNANSEISLVLTFNKKDISNLENIEKSIISTPMGMFKFENYEMGCISPVKYSHTNSWIADKFFDSEYAFIINNTFTNIENMFTNKLVKMVQEFKPQLIECKLF